MGNYANVTEIPGQRATSDQLSNMMTRYHLAKQYAKGKDVLEIACGSGTGLGYLGKVANTVVGGDIDSELVNIASANYSNADNVEVKYLDAQSLPFADNSFDLLILFEALYYIADTNKFVDEAIRVTRPEGIIIIATVNSEWHGFNPSPFSKKYHTAEELLSLFAGKADIELKVGFEDLPTGNNYLISMLKRLAVKFRLIPKTMKGKEIFKRLFYGKLKAIPSVLYDGLGKLENLISYQEKKNEKKHYKQLYLIAKVTK